jgi:hypothetical protein
MEYKVSYEYTKHRSSLVYMLAEEIENNPSAGIITPLNPLVDKVPSPDLGYNVNSCSGIVRGS